MSQKIKVWFHAGMPKCGSSAVQVFFAKNREKFLKKNLHYPEFGLAEDAKKGKITSGNGFKIAKEILDSKDDRDIEAICKKILEECKKYNVENHVISSELFYSIPLEKWKILLDVLGVDADVYVAFFVRRQDQFLMSSYMQKVKRKGLTTYPEDFFTKSYKKHNLKYYEKTKGLVSVFGNGNVFPMIYEDALERDGVCGALAKEILGELPDWVLSGKNEIINTSLTPFEIKLMLVCNKFQPRMNFSDFLVENSIRSMSSNVGEPHQIIPFSMVEEIVEYYKEDNDKFISTFCFDTGFPEPTAYEFIDVNKIEISSQEVIEVILGMMVSLDRRMQD